MLEPHGAVVARLYRRADAARWSLPEASFAAALERSLCRRFSGDAPAASDVVVYLESLHVEDLALASACARGDDRAWEHFVSTLRPVLYRAAAAIVGAEAGRELADSLYADLYGLDDSGCGRRSLFDYYHGRSALAGWLRAVLAQRSVDRVREQSRCEPLPDDAEMAAPAAGTSPADPDRPRLLALFRTALLAALGGLDARDRLRLAWYYADELTLAQIGRQFGEHEATTSRKLERTRRGLRAAVERRLAGEDGLTQEQIALCFEYALGDWPFDLREALPVDSGVELRVGAKPGT
jgi:RNA polymerase sigma factor (sigma-70 family)